MACGGASVAPLVQMRQVPRPAVTATNRLFGDGCLTTEQAAEIDLESNIQVSIASLSVFVMRESCVLSLGVQNHHFHHHNYQKTR